MPSVSVNASLDNDSTNESPVEKPVRKYKSGNVLRLDIPIPFFMRNEVFGNFKKSDYSWISKSSYGGGFNNVEPGKSMVLFVRSPDAPRINEIGGERVEGLSFVKAKAQGEYSIGGCPLECPFDLNEDFEEALVIDDIPTVFEGIKIPAKYSPMDIDSGKWAIRQITAQMEPFHQDMNLVNDTEKSGWPADDSPVFSLVDTSAQKRGLIFTGFRRKFKAMSVSCLGQYPPEADCLSLKYFRRYHDQNVGVDNKPVTAIAHAVYEKLHGEHPSNGKVYLEFLFKEPIGVFELPPEGSSSKIAIRPQPGDANPSMLSLWKEIQDLERWVNFLGQGFEIGADHSTSLMNSTTTNFDLQDEKITANVVAIQSLLAKEPALPFDFGKDSVMDSSLDFVLQDIVNLKRVDCDFTDILWSRVRGCENVEELQDCLQLVMKAVSDKMYRPYLLPDNKTEMASMLSKVMKEDIRSTLKMKNRKVMVQTIIECGLTKLFKDYNFTLARTHLIERGGIDNFTPSNNLPASLEKVKKLHCVLEIMCLTKERLNLATNIQVNHVKKMLDLFASSTTPVDWNQVYHFDVPPNDIRRVMSGLHPIYFKVKMESQTFLKWASTSVIVSPEKYICHRKPAEEHDIRARKYYVYVFCEEGSLGESRD